MRPPQTEMVLDHCQFLYGLLRLGWYNSGTHTLKGVPLLRLLVCNTLQQFCDTCCGLGFVTPVTVL